MNTIGQAFRAHAQELAGLPASEERARILMIWRQAIDEEAHDYADLVLAHSQREEIIRLEVETIMQAYLVGYMGARGWIDPIEAQQASYTAGRFFRDQLRSLGVPVETLKGSFATVIDDALAEIVQLGLQAMGDRCYEQPLS